MAEKNKKKREVETIIERQFIGDVTPIQAILPIVNPIFFNLFAPIFTFSNSSASL